MERSVLIKNEISIWKEDFEVESAETAKEEIKEVVDYFNSSLKEGEKRREFLSMAIANKKCLYFADMMGDINEDLEVQIIKPLIEKGILFKKIETTEAPPFGERTYDILFFDYGGMSMGNSCMEHFCKYIIEESQDYPNRLYVMVSTFTESAMKDVISEFGDDIKTHNIFLNIESFASHWNNVED